MDATYKMLVLKKVDGVYFNLNIGIYDGPGAKALRCAFASSVQDFKLTHTAIGLERRSS